MSDPRGPIRSIEAIEERNDATFLLLDCGHVSTVNQIFHYKVGRESRCLQCGDIAESIPVSDAVIAIYQQAVAKKKTCHQLPVCVIL